MSAALAKGGYDIYIVQCIGANIIGKFFMKIQNVHFEIIGPKCQIVHFVIIGPKMSKCSLLIQQFVGVGLWSLLLNQ